MKLAKRPLWFSKMAADKVRSLVKVCDHELEWYGIVSKRHTKQKHTFYVMTDILIPPQYVYAAYVEDADEAFSQWTYDIWRKGDLWDHVHCYGHSHVQFGVDPSVTDRRTQEKVVWEMDGEGFYLFTIINKKDELWIGIQDFDVSDQMMLFKFDQCFVLPGKGMSDSEKESWISGSRKKMFRSIMQRRGEHANEHDEIL